VGPKEFLMRFKVLTCILECEVIFSFSLLPSTTVIKI
jgi:hypothetical protein